MRSPAPPAVDGPDQGLDHQYAQALLGYCQCNGEEELSRAYDIARSALGEGAPLTWLHQTHQTALLHLPRDTDTNACASFFIEALSVYDMAFRGYGQTIEWLTDEVDERKRVETDLRSATFDLARQRDDLDAKVAKNNRELREKVAQLNHVNARLAQTNQEQAEFTYSLSHDLMAPLNTIRTMLTFLDEDLENAGVDREFETLIAARTTANRMMKIVEDILGYSRAIGLETVFEAVDLNTVFSELEADLQGDVRAQNAQLVIDPMPAVDGAPTQLRLLFQNILSNAIKFRHPDRTPVVTVTQRQATPADMVEIAISDNGVGIAKAHFERIFGLFQRLHTYDEYPGTGLGLTLCKRIVATHGGKISLTSNVGHGTELVVSLRKAGDGTH